MNALTRRGFLAAAGVGAAAQEAATQRMNEIPAGPVPMSAERRWTVQHLIDEDDTDAVMNDIQFASAQRGIAVGGVNRKGHEEPIALVTRDGGAKWTQVKLKDFALSVQMVDESQIFYVGRNDLWFSNEGGLTWEKRKLPKPDKAARDKGALISRVSFLDSKTGWAFGGGKTFFRTDDGGLTWKPVPESSALDLKTENTMWMWMTKVAPGISMLLGHSAPPPRDESRFPDWMVPERAVRRRLTPASTVVAETHDGGATWKTSVASTFGRAVRARTLGNRGLVVYMYGDGLAFPAEVYAMELGTSKTKPFFRRRGVYVQDAVPLNGGGGLVAAVEPHGRLQNSPIPGKVRVFRTLDGGAWQEMKVDYRATGRRVILARHDDANIWLCTSEGHILKMV